ncbi:MAG: sulfatase-like hydrolase/transferase [Verrucomicrobiales bacterium]|nr:sulfatase-like hydrolase/transferase [Verrucomicrobiales bacterium]
MIKKIPYFLVAAVLLSPMLRAAELPNILWITSEDNGPHLGCYGDEYAVTPNLDALAERGLRYTRASSNAPVCAPARTTVISGIFPPATGAEHMRSETSLPDAMKMFPVYLRELGYYTTNAAKEDYNLVTTGKVWDESSGKAHWKNRKEGQPFFAVFNETISHESKIRNPIEDELRIHDPAKARIPAYHPDTPEVRKDWAQYYDRITQMDASLGARLQEIEDAGLADNTIVIYWGDHGSGMPRNKRWPYNSGLHVPFIAHFPAKWKDLAPDEYKVGGTSDRMIGFIDLAPTMLSLVGLEPKPWMQGHAFAGQFETKSPEYSYGFRGRMDERVDLVRTVLGKRYVYIRQYMPHRIYGQYIDYMFQTPTTRVWHEMYEAGKLNEAQSHFWEEKPAEELYDLETDPDEVNNLADSAEHGAVLAKMRKAHQEWEKEIRDVGFLPEAEVHARSEGSTPYEMGHDPEKYDFDAVFAAAQLASSKKAEDLPAILDLLKSDDAGVRYWGATGLLIHKEAGFTAGREALHAALGDECASVAIVAAESLGRFGDAEDQKEAVATLLSHGNQVNGNLFEAILALNAIDYLDEAAASESEAILALPAKPAAGTPRRISGYVGSVLKKLRADFGK